MSGTIDEFLLRFKGDVSHAKKKVKELNTYIEKEGVKVASKEKKQSTNKIRDINKEKEARAKAEQRARHDLAARLKKFKAYKKLFKEADELNQTNKLKQSATYKMLQEREKLLNSLAEDREDTLKRILRTSRQISDEQKKQFLPMTPFAKGDMSKVRNGVNAYNTTGKSAAASADTFNKGFLLEQAVTAQNVRNLKEAIDNIGTPKTGIKKSDLLTAKEAAPVKSEAEIKALKEAALLEEAKADFAKRERARALDEILEADKRKAKSAEKSADVFIKHEADKEKAAKEALDRIRKKIEADAAARLRLEKRVQEKINTIKRSRSYHTLGDISPSAQKQADEKIKQLKDSMDLKGLQDYQAELVRTTSRIKKHRNSLFSLHGANKMVASSMHNLVASYASAFAMIGGTIAIKEVGMTLESVQASLVAVSGGTEEAAQEMEYLTEESMRLGLNLKKTAKDYAKFYAAVGKKTDKETVREMFEGLNEAAVVGQLTADETSGAFKALGQMFSKGGIMAEEFKGQLGDRLPIALRALEAATGKTSDELMKMMEMGQLGTEYIPKFTKALRELANENGALQESLKTLRVAEGQLILQSQIAAKTIYDNGFKQGLTKLYYEIKELLKRSEPTLKKIGSLFQSLFEGIAYGIKVLEPYIKGFINAFEYLFAGVLFSNVARLGKTLQIGLTPLLGWLAGILFLIEEIASFFSDELVGSIERASGKQFNIGANSIRDLRYDEKTKQYYDAGNERSMTGAMKESARELAEEYVPSGFIDGLDTATEAIGRFVSELQSNQQRNLSKLYGSDMNWFSKVALTGLSGLHATVDTILPNRTENPLKAGNTVSNNFEVNVNSVDEANQFVEGVAYDVPVTPAHRR